MADQTQNASTQATGQQASSNAGTVGTPSPQQPPAREGLQIFSNDTTQPAKPGGVIEQGGA